MDDLPSAKVKNEISKKYVKMEQREHVLLKSNMYLGSIETDKYDIWLLNEDGTKMEKKNVNYIAGLFKIFDEVVANASDHYIRLKGMTNSKQEVNLVKDIKVNIDKETGVITVTNSGDGIDIIVHPDHKIYIPELIFGNMLTSTNYSDDEKMGVGQNGIGGKATNIFSEWFEIETVDANRKLIYNQRFESNMSIVNPPEITKCSKKPYTIIKFKPDYKRFGGGMTKLSDDMYEVMRKRVYDLCAVTDKDISIYFNDQKLEFKTFENYVNLYIGSKSIHTRVYEIINERWEIIASYNNFNGFEQISFVNGLLTIRGGKHVDYITNQIVKKTTELIEKKCKGKQVKPQAIKDNIIVFIKCTIINPAFDSQSKETLTTPMSKFGSKAEISDKFIEKLYKSGLADKVLEICAIHEDKALKKTDGKKQNVIRGLPKLEDANWAGTNKGNECLLLLCEGDSASSTCLAGLSVVGRDKFGVFPLKGKVMNVKDAAVQKIADNDEISNIKKILGLETGKKYTKIDDLRYGGIMLMVDQDLDGSHIKGLIMNLFHTLWPTLAKDFKFIHCMQTPIVKVKRRDEVISFYTITDFENWKNEHSTGWDIKYYKGLGTSTDEEAMEYFRNMKKVTYTFTDQSNECMNMAFDKKRADDRKTWLGNYNRKEILDCADTEVKYEDFINKELIHFSNYDIERSIPNMIDGLKISQRKILYACFKRNLTDKEIRVAQLASYVSEHSAYHHGEASLQGAIVAMAQDFVGANNINILKPNGQFGCLAPDTDIIMWNSTIKKAKDIVIGDKLIGDDGKVRNVLKTTSGIDTMYEIKMLNGESYTVNSQHILTLKYKANKSIFWRESDKSWKVEYFDNINFKVKSKSFRTIESTTNNHFNAAKLSKDAAYNKITEFVNELKFPDIFDIKIEDLLKLSKSNQIRFYCVKNSSCIEWNYQPVFMDPYIFGCWIGDGNSNGTGITSMDEEILQAFVKYSDTISCELVHDPNGKHENKDIHENYHFTIRKQGAGIKTSIGDNNHCPENCIGCMTSGKIHSICNFKFEKTHPNKEHFKGQNIYGETRYEMNPWKELLKKHNLFNNKHIPIKYILNDKDTRLKMLAGVIDTDGTVKNMDVIPRIVITQSKRLRSHIIKSLELVARSLGFKTTISTVKNDMLTKKSEPRELLCLMIYGNNLDKIPTRLPRKQVLYKKDRLKDAYISGFKINKIGSGEFCGWSVDGNERFLLGDFTITHNSRLMGGKDAAQPRYIHTLLTDVATSIYRKVDGCVLKYLEDDGLGIEPEHYVPIIPMILVNGAIGIGTGFSTTIPSYNPLDIVGLIKRMLANEHVSVADDDLIPWYKGFTGEIKKADTKCYSIGKFTKSGCKIDVIELPIGYWTFDFKVDLEKALDTMVDFKKYENQSAGNKVHFTLHFSTTIFVDKLMVVEANGFTKFENTFGLISTKGLSTSNMYAFNVNGVITKFETVFDIINEFYDVRLEYYKKRKEYILVKLQYDVDLMANKIRFIKEVVSETIIVHKIKKAELEKYLLDNNYMKHDDSFDYIVRIPVYNLTTDKVEDLEKDIAKSETEIDDLTNKKPEEIWSEELSEFEKIYAKFLDASKLTKASTSKAITSKASTSKAITSKASTSKASTSKASTSKAITSKASTSKASTSKASTSKASTSKAATKSKKK